ncbi:hypothetical protein [Paenarthrobacter sp. YJN-5]|uniref:hypothetical protein n=1 Tax=Paenarthrobacter sp. YJN-5 TaxID=2735316 RepID=UPI0018778D9C|nr:hypothetical protein [Paenarthrobacter sp. YJN-5]QOT19492.1 hypothetical protein HMI59_22915 [Paenarthrobacter sp. YJN-5]
MTTLEVILICTNVWMLGVLAIVAIEEARRWSREEKLALVFWFAWVPFALSVRTYRRWRWRCRDCGRRGESKKYYYIHRQARSNCPGTSIPNPYEATS